MPHQVNLGILLIELLHFPSRETDGSAPSRCHSSVPDWSYRVSGDPRLRDNIHIKANCAGVTPCARPIYGLKLLSGILCFKASGVVRQVPTAVTLIETLFSPITPGTHAPADNKVRSRYQALPMERSGFSSRHQMAYSSARPKADRRHAPDEWNGHSLTVPNAELFLRIKSLTVPAIFHRYFRIDGADTRGQYGRYVGVSKNLHRPADMVGTTVDSGRLFLPRHRNRTSFDFHFIAKRGKCLADPLFTGIGP